jgi:hypothetical protein
VPGGLTSAAFPHTILYGNESGCGFRAAVGFLALSPGGAARDRMLYPQQQD